MKVRPGLVRPPGFEVPSRCLDGFPGRWVGSPLDAFSYVLDQARLRPLNKLSNPISFLPYYQCIVPVNNRLRAFSTNLKNLRVFSRMF